MDTKPGYRTDKLAFTPFRRWSLCVTMPLQGTLPSFQSQILLIQLAGWGVVQPPTHLHLFLLALANAAA